jgi:hypothetical protein
MMDAAVLAKFLSRLSYDPETGLFTRLKPWGSKKAGQLTGRLTWDGYRRISVGGRDYAAHRIAWLVVYGVAPSDEIDHINGNRDDNRIANLRVVTRSENCRNRRLRSDNTHGVPGVYFHAATNRWCAQSCHGGKNKNLGSFRTFEEAAAVRAKFQEDHGYHSNHGRKAA